MLKSLLPDDVKVNVTIDDNRLKSSFTINKTVRLTKRSFLYTILANIQNHGGPLSDNEGFVQKLEGYCQSDKPLNILGIDKTHSKRDCINGSIVNGIREPSLYSFGLILQPGHGTHHTVKVSKRSIKLFCLINHFIWKTTITNVDF